MGSYFKSWRGKTGVLLLVMALIFMGGWIRSLTIIDEFEIPLDHLYTVYSASGALDGLQWRGSDRRASGILGDGPRLWHSMSNDLPAAWRYAPTLPHRYSEEINYGPELGLLETEGRYGPDRIATGTGIKIAYSSIVIPLKLLSAWLLFLERRRVGESRT